ncbi:DUF1499 domain-containing protein [Leptolyngbya ohadii]|uniref:DUF1499 domain-containing protein n=1 Tax=Leptolyngbya ohadii TaxID=1962290 RepID=UPI0021F22296|nr:DUF1499 domain-containing protein [Leptolyngbya ohadii]
MLTSGLSLCFAAFLTLMLWLGVAANGAAQTLFTAPETSVSSANLSTEIASSLFPKKNLLTAQITAPIVAMGKPLFHFSGQRPDNLGIKSGRLTSCPTTPNCVNSQASPADPTHFIQPITFTSAPDQAMANLKGVIQSLDRTEIIAEQPDYLYAEFTSALMGFVDDVEFSLDKDAGVIQVRSASRLGESDLEVNRKRIEMIREKLADREANSP